MSNSVTPRVTWGKKRRKESNLRQSKMRAKVFADDATMFILSVGVVNQKSMNKLAAEVECKVH